MDVILVPLFTIINTLIGLYIWVVIIHVVLSWLIGFNIINTKNKFVTQVAHLLSNMTEPLLQPIRRILPTMSGLDFSPLVLVLALYFLQMVLVRFELRAFG